MPFKATTVSTGTVPKGSMWRRNPLPRSPTLWDREGPSFEPICEESEACKALTVRAAFLGRASALGLSHTEILSLWRVRVRAVSGASRRVSARAGPQDLEERLVRQLPLLRPLQRPERERPLCARRPFGILDPGPRSWVWFGRQSTTEVPCEVPLGSGSGS
jgi:hypothetical protein